MERKSRRKMATVCGTKISSNDSGGTKGGEKAGEGGQGCLWEVLYGGNGRGGEAVGSVC